MPSGGCKPTPQPCHVPSRELSHLLPIVERELRALVHHSWTWWRRVGTVALAMVILVFVVLSTSRWASLSMIGQTVFTALASCAMIYVLLAGPLRTADCLSRERREGTLGLLFLTNLHSYDVVAGKIAVTSLETIFHLVAALPLVAIPFLMGGVTLSQFAQVVIAIFNLMFLSLAIGVAVSSFFVSGRTAFAVTLLILASLTLALPLIGEEVLRLQFNSTEAAFFYMFSPLYTIALCAEQPGWRGSWKFWLNAAALHSLAWLAIIIACQHTKKSWRDLPESTWIRKWRHRFNQWTTGQGDQRQRKLWLTCNPILWLEGRDLLQARFLWALLGVSALLFVAFHSFSPRRWPDADFVVAWSLLVHYVLCIWIALQSPRRLADDKQSGALELLLSTPLTPAAMVGGAMLVWRRRFGWPLLFLLGLDLFLLHAFYQGHPISGPLLSDDLFQISLCALVVFPLQAWSLARIGLYQGLRCGNSLRATFISLWMVGLLPWLLFIGFIITCETGRQYFRFLPRINDEIAFSAWTGAHVLPCCLFVAVANWRLRRHFRALAAQNRNLSSWRRLKNILNRASSAPGKQQLPPARALIR